MVPSNPKPSISFLLLIPPSVNLFLRHEDDGYESHWWLCGRLTVSALLLLLVMFLVTGIFASRAIPETPAGAGFVIDSGVRREGCSTLGIAFAVPLPKAFYRWLRAILCATLVGSQHDQPLYVRTAAKYATLPAAQVAEFCIS